MCIYRYLYPGYYKKQTAILDSGGSSMSTVESRIRDMGLTLPGHKKAPTHCGSKRCGDLLFIGARSGSVAGMGKIGAVFTLQDGYDAAWRAGKAVLAEAADALGDLDRVDCVLRCVVLVCAVRNFTQYDAVADGFTDALTETLGARGMHARTVLGALELPDGAAVSGDAIMKIR